MKKKIALFMSAAICITGLLTNLPTGSFIKTENTVYAEETVDMSARLDMSELYGYAAVEGNGLETTTGGGNTTPVVVTTLAELKAAVGDDTPRVVAISGTITCPDWPVSVGSNKTIVGIDDDAKLLGGFNIQNASNIIVCNLNVEGPLPDSGPDDTFNIDNSHHIWLNHLNVWNSKDGSIDIKTGSDYITVSWCKLWYDEENWNEWIAAGKKDHRLACLIGSGAGDHDDTDMGKLHVTYHHNWFADLVNERMPRVMYGRVHVYNNYYSCKGNAYCIGADSYASVLVENNYFKNVKNPHEFSYPDLDYPAGIVARGNKYVKTSGSRDSGQKLTNKKVKLFETTVYDYMLNDAEDIEDVVTAYAGPKNLNDKTLVPDKLNSASLVEGVEDVNDVNPDATPLPTLTPVNQTNDNAITYDKSTDTYTYHGQNSDKSNAYYTIENPFKNVDFKEDLTFAGGYPLWSKGATISYWVNLPKDASDAAVLNFNLENDRQMQREDAYKYNMCQNYSESDGSYTLGKVKTYIDSSGKEYTVLSGYGKNVQYNPNYPAAGYYEVNSEGGAIKAYEKDSDSSKESNWVYLSYIGEGYYESYSVRYDEEGGNKSKIAEANISGSFSLYASGSIGYRQDNWSGLQMNPYLESYGNVIDAHQFNQFYYWANGSTYSLNGSKLKSPTMESKGEWHFVVVVIQNNWVQCYVDGVELTTDYINYWGQSLTSDKGYHAAGQGFNLGYGARMRYLTNKPSVGFSTDMLLLDFISDEDTVLTVGGLGAGAERLGQNVIGTPDGTKVKNIKFYNIPVEKKYIKSNKIDLDYTSETAKPVEPTETPTASTEPTEPVKTDSPVNVILGDITGDNIVGLDDALESLKAAVGIIKIEDTVKFKAADVDEDKILTLNDTMTILKMALGII